MAEHAPSTGDDDERRKLNPAALPITYAAQVLTRMGGGRITEEMIRADIDAGAPTNDDSRGDGTINLVHYAAWFVQQMNPSGGRRGD